MLSACATSGKRVNYQYIFQEEIDDNKESVSSGSPSQAIQNLGMLLEMDPKNKDARFLRAAAYQKMDNYEDAVEDYNSLLEYYPNEAKAHYNLAMIYAFKIVDKRSALKHFDSFLTLDIKNPKAFEVAKIMCALARIENRQSSAGTSFADWSLKESFGEADAKARKNMLLGAAKLDPTRPEPFIAMAKIAEENGNIADAIKNYQLALGIDPTLADAHHRLGQLLLQEGKKAEADMHLAKASLFNPNNS